MIPSDVPWVRVPLTALGVIPLMSVKLTSAPVVGVAVGAPRLAPVRGRLVGDVVSPLHAEWLPITDKVLLSSTEILVASNRRLAI